MQQTYAAICLISTRKVPRHGLDFRVTASLKSQCNFVIFRCIAYSKESLERSFFYLNVDALFAKIGLESTEW